MIKRAAIILSAVTLSVELALPPKGFADDMKKDPMSKDSIGIPRQARHQMGALPVGLRRQ
jgi:pentapeptide MXKDX repeat protein